MSAADVRDAAHRENFPVASRLLPRAYRRDLMAVYGFARYVDDVGDEGDPAGRPALLDAVEADLGRLYAGGSPRLPAVRALGPLVAGRGVPRTPFLHLVEANRRDQVVRRYDTFAQLLAYCELSANPVGRIVLHVFGVATPERARLSDRICSALQVIEHCQDVGEDHARGRVYLPGEDLRRFGCREADLDAPRTSPRLRRAVALQARRAATLLDEGMPLLETLSGFARTAVAGYIAGGRAALAALERGRHDVLGGAVRARRRAVLSEWMRVLKEVNGDGSRRDS
ncbi:squalene synthase HpnC [Microbispora rosea]|uniref:Squalene synthase HpnC n=1 Tax=Microbispora rosea TaxID=58117 RepID=A0A1N6XIG7_9ACTN|nr:squalene synthase HpnC [Microbispora rosea]GIH52147.1 phytoene synthase [Microbispora rosea subsp. rosea]SIR02148.1 squalene synthase HpnC [Microbispora rosea]